MRNIFILFATPASHLKLHTREHSFYPFASVDLYYFLAGHLFELAGYASTNSAPQPQFKGCITTCATNSCQVSKWQAGLTFFDGFIFFFLPFLQIPFLLLYCIMTIVWLVMQPRVSHSNAQTTPWKNGQRERKGYKSHPIVLVFCQKSNATWVWSKIVKKI